MNQILLFKHRLLLSFLFTGLCLSSLAQTIKGKISDSKTGEPLTGATVRIERGDFKQSTSAKLDGSYIFKGLQNGAYKLKVNFVGYRSSPEIEVTVSNSIAIQNITLQDLSTELTEVAVTGQGSKVSDRSARGLEKGANSVVNILSQNTIQLLPDVTVGNALQRG